MNENKFLSTDPGTGPMEAAKPLPFKDPNFMHSGIGGAAAGKKNRTWKNLKQILASERALPWQLNDPSYFNIDAPPSFKPAKKYSDISGLPANYTDPQSKLRFSTIEEFAYIRMLPSDVVTGYLALRKATTRDSPGPLVGQEQSPFFFPAHQQTAADALGHYPVASGFCVSIRRTVSRLDQQTCN
ncbi:INO80 complex subunit C isoform X2 [Alligator sinensis]|uniref:INO80 complex subunit C isoform X2 n=1 Tax=Alligator sinensis TaxID=38654 RepID=A0A3Q0HBI6_ALLSI|nr:INO80 complex subunit C isoform X2 [Alligator sinensis]